MSKRLFIGSILSMALALTAYSTSATAHTGISAGHHSYDMSLSGFQERTDSTVYTIHAQKSDSSLDRSVVVENDYTAGAFAKFSARTGKQLYTASVDRYFTLINKRRFHLVVNVPFRNSDSVKLKKPPLISV